MNSYDYNSLKAAAEEAEVWIDVRDANTPRGRGTGNTNKKERISRALSWYEKSELTEDADERLMFAFVAYNALYAQPIGGESEKYTPQYRGVFWEKIQKTGDGTILDFAKSESGKLKKILSMQYISFSYWKDEKGWREKYEIMQKEAEWAKRAVSRNLDLKVVRAATERIGLLRNQILHGMAAYGDSYNRKQVRLCADFLHPLVGRMIATVIGDKKQNWGKVPYPPQGYPNESRIEIEELED